MAILDTLDTAKTYLQEIQRNRRFQRENLNRQDAAELQAALAKCRGKMEVCKKDFERTIRSQSRNIEEGLKLGADTGLQEQMLWDATIGYMLVKDAIYALSTIASRHSVAHAYEMLDAVTRQMSGKKSSLPLKRVRERNVYGYITSEMAIEKKSELLATFFDRLKATGDIEDCLAKAKQPASLQADRSQMYTKGRISPGMTGAGERPISAADRAMKNMGAFENEGKDETDYTAGLDDVYDTDRPV